MPPDVPVTVTVYVPVAIVLVELMVSVTVLVWPDVRAALVLLSVAFGPVGDTTSVILTVPAKPYMLVSDIVDVAVVPLATVIEFGFAEIEKSVIATGIVM